MKFHLDLMPNFSERMREAILPLQYAFITCRGTAISFSYLSCYLYMMFSLLLVIKVKNLSVYKIFCKIKLYIIPYKLCAKRKKEQEKKKEK